MDIVEIVILLVGAILIAGTIVGGLKVSAWMKADALLNNSITEEIRMRAELQDNGIKAEAKILSAVFKNINNPGPFVLETADYQLSLEITLPDGETYILKEEDLWVDSNGCTHMPKGRIKVHLRFQDFMKKGNIIPVVISHHDKMVVGIDEQRADEMLA